MAEDYSWLFQQGFDPSFLNMDMGDAPSYDPYVPYDFLNMQAGGDVTQQGAFDPYAAPEAAGLPPSAPEPALSWRQRLANSFAPEQMFPGADQGMRDAAFTGGLNRLGDVLVAAGMAPDKRSAARVLAQAIPASRSAYQGALQEIIKTKRGEEDRAFLEEQRQMQREDMEEKKRQRAAGEAERESLSKMNFDEQFEGLIGDEDLTPAQRENYKLRFEKATNAFKANPTPENADRVLSIIGEVAEKAGRSEEFGRQIAEGIELEAAKMNMSVEEYKEKYLPAKIRNQYDEWAAAKGQRADAADARRDAAEQREFARRVREAFESGKPMESGDYFILPSGTGTYVVKKDAYNPNTGKSTGSLSNDELYQAVKTLSGDADFLSALDTADSMPVTPSFSIKLARLGFDVPPGTSLSPQQVEQIRRRMIRPIDEAPAAPTAAPPPPPGKKTVTMDEIRKDAENFGISVEAAKAARQARGYTVVGE